MSFMTEWNDIQIDRVDKEREKKTVGEANVE